LNYDVVSISDFLDLSFDIQQDHRSSSPPPSLAAERRVTATTDAPPLIRRVFWTLKDRAPCFRTRPLTAAFTIAHGHKRATAFDPAGQSVLKIAQA